MVEWTRLESVRGCKLTVGSNPTLSALRSLCMERSHSGLVQRFTKPPPAKRVASSNLALSASRVTSLCSVR